MSPVLALPARAQAGARPERRADLEGLRGLAVLSVFAVHTLPDAMPGGFVGVDVFFVLSGYLIASISLPQIERGSFHVGQFYERRLRRLVPALLPVLVSALAFAAFMATPRDTLTIGRHVAAGAGFLSNWALWQEGGYFDAASELKPLLHLWSLGVEVQFYLAWPLLALAMVRWPRYRLAVVMVPLAVSFALNLLWVDSRPQATFFLPMTRAWEMLVGVALACVHWPASRHTRSEEPGHQVNKRPLAPWMRAWQPGPPPGRHRADWAAGTGLGLLAASILLIEKSTPYPGAWALLPVIGTVLLIAARGRGVIAGWLLTRPLLVFYGGISYSLYLWHYPLLAFPRLMGLELEPLQVVALLMLAVALACVTTYGLEPSLRDQSSPRRRWGMWLLLALLGAAGAALASGDGLPARLPPELRSLAADHARFDTRLYRSGVCFAQRTEDGAEVFGRACEPEARHGVHRVLIWGDSHAASLWPGMDARLTQGHPEWSLGQMTAAACPPLPANSSVISARCQAINRAVLARIAALRPDTVVLAASWTSYTEVEQQDLVLNALSSTMDALRAAGVLDLLLVGPLPQWRVEPPRRVLGAIWMGQPAPLRWNDGNRVELALLDQRLRSLAASHGARFHSPLETACDVDGCRLARIEPDGRVSAMAFDISHLTAAGSLEIAGPLVDTLTRPDAGRSPAALQ